MARGPTRRSLLAAAVSPLAGGCLELLHGPGERTPAPEGRTTVRASDGAGHVELANDVIYATFDREAGAKLAGVHAVGFRNQGDLTGPVETNPVTPVSTTDKVSPEYRRTRTVEVTRDARTVGQFRVYRDYVLDGTPFSVEWLVSLPAGEQFLLLALQFANRGKESVVLNHSDGDTHDGFQLLHAVGLRGRRGSASGYRFATSRHGPMLFDEQPLWRSFPGIRHLTVFDDDAGVTCGYLDGDTGPKLAVARRQALDFMVNEVTLGPGETISYRVVVAVHRGGDRAVRAGTELYDRARRWVRYDRERIRRR